MQLTATKTGRQIFKDKNVYPIMREFHIWEKDVHVSAACEKLVQVGDENKTPVTFKDPLMASNVSVCAFNVTAEHLF